MTADTESHPNDPHVEALGRVRQVTLPPAARALSTLSHVDYEDAFLVETGPAQDRTGEQWARAILEDAPMSTRNALSRGWSALGLRPGSTQSDRLVLGWEVRRTTPDVALLGASGRLGSGCRANCSSNASSTRCSSPPSYNWRTASHAHCGPESRPGTDRSCGTSSSRPAARNGARANHEPGHCHRPSRPTAQDTERVLPERFRHRPPAPAWPRTGSHASPAAAKTVVSSHMTGSAATIRTPRRPRGTCRDTGTR